MKFCLCFPVTFKVACPQKTKDLEIPISIEIAESLHELKEGDELTVETPNNPKKPDTEDVVDWNFKYKKKNLRISTSADKTFFFYFELTKIERKLSVVQDMEFDPEFVRKFEKELKKVLQHESKL